MARSSSRISDLLRVGRRLRGRGRVYTRAFGRAPAAVARLEADGSQRLYFRLTGDAPASVVGAYGPDPEENRAFLSFSRSCRGIGLPVPEIFAADEDERIWLEEDLGDTTLFQALASAREARAGAAARARRDHGLKEISRHESISSAHIARDSAASGGRDRS